jgi:hypothetical protein
MAASLAGGVKETGSRQLWRRSRLTVARPLFFFLSSNRESRVWHKADVIIALTDVRFPGRRTFFQGARMSSIWWSKTN